MIRCDRGENSREEGSIVVYQMQHPERWTTALVKELLYTKQQKNFIQEGIQSFLGLERIANIPITNQIIGNCSWANIEASILVLLYLLQWDQITNISQAIEKDIHSAEFYNHWVKWDKTRALEVCFKQFEYAEPARRATIAMLLGAVLFQACRYENPQEVKIALKLIPILMVPEYQYILNSYLEIYWYKNKTQAGHNLMQLLNVAGVMLPAHQRLS